jgi:hypothetical protein
MSTAQKEYRCVACGQGFDGANNPVGHPIPSFPRCVYGQHEGPFERIGIVIAHCF